ncbi:hypothetical protein AMR72_01305 [Flavobacterium psychrophilum]|nr:hypothetical protein AMR72_01305 [Flavobacterium psychrophilum]AOE51277.1 hypothetical protein ALW18_01305 [Flavobacterium psychrophilum]
MKKVSVLQMQQFQAGTSPEDFYANTLQNHLVTSHKDIALPHSHNFYLAILFTKGSGIHEVDFTVFDVKPGALFFLNPGQTHHWELSKDTEGYIFFHTQAFYDLHYTNNRLSHFPFFFSMHNSPCIYLAGKQYQNITNWFRLILQENQSQNILKREYIISLTDLVYNEGTRYYKHQNIVPIENRNNYYAKFRHFEELVGEHFTNKKSPSAYAGMLNMTSKHLNRITQAVVDKTASDVIMDRVLLEAKKAFILQKDSFAEIGYSLGYDDYAYFSRLFKKKTGETPSAFLGRYKRDNHLNHYHE